MLLFAVSKLTENGFFPDLPSSIRVWNPAVNNGIPVIVADENNVDFYPSKGNTSDGFLPLTRPAIGRSSSGSVILMVFNATTGIYGNDSCSYYKGMFSYTSDFNSWSQPERITPESPLYDWRYFSISQVNNISGNNFDNINIMCQADSLPGAYVNGSEPSPAEAVCLNFYPVGINQISGEVSDKFNLYQNYPNPFNPKTVINYELRVTIDFVSIKVFDVLGNEVSTLVNEKQTAGSYSVTFDGINFPSGVYFYKLTAGDFIDTKRMVIVK